MGPEEDLLSCTANASGGADSFLRQVGCRRGFCREQTLPLAKTTH